LTIGHQKLDALANRTEHGDTYEVRGG
jgi:hypothetical protein